MIEEDKEFVMERPEIIEKIMQKQKIIDELKLKVDKFEQERIRLFEDQAKLAKLYEMGCIDSHGDPLPNIPEDNDEMS